MLYVSAGNLEHCPANKKTIRIVCPDIWVHYIISGAGYYNDKRLAEGDGFIVYKNNYCTYRPDENDPWTYIWVRFCGEDDDELLKKSNLPQTSGSFHFDYKDRLIKIANELLTETLMYDENVCYREGIARLILSLAVQERSSGHSDRKQTVMLAKEYIALNFHKELKIEKMAKDLYVDRKYLRNLFMHYLGISTKEYLTRYRIERAKEMLWHGNEKISAIATSVGYSDPLAFCRIFNQRVGLTPGEYRKRKKKE